MPRKNELYNEIKKTVFITSKSGVRIVAGDEITEIGWLFDFRALLLQPKWLDAYAELFWEKYKDSYPFQVCGMETAAISLVSAIVMKSVQKNMPINGLYIRKSRKRNGLLKQVEGVPNEHPVIVVDDLINKGNTILKQILILEEISLKVTDVFVYVKFRKDEEYATITKRDISISSLFDLEEFTSLGEYEHNSLSNFETVWKFDAKVPMHNLVYQKSTLILDNVHIFFGTDEGKFYCLSQDSGAIIWDFKIHNYGITKTKGIQSSPALYNDVVFFGAYDGTVYALHKNDGSIQWTFEEADWVGSSPTIASDKNLLYIGVEYGLQQKRGGVVALTLDSGELVWKQEMPDYTHSSPLYIKEENLVVVGCNNSMVYAYNATTGEKVWEFICFGEPKASFSYDPKRKYILFGTLGGQFYILSAKDGWPVQALEQTSLFSTPYIVGDTAFFTSLDKYIYSIDLKTFKINWKTLTRGRIFCSPNLFAGSLWIGSNDGCVYELDPETGDKKNTFQFSERVGNKIEYNDETKNIFVQTLANEVYCIKK